LLCCALPSNNSFKPTAGVGQLIKPRLGLGACCGCWRFGPSHPRRTIAHYKWLVRHVLRPRRLPSNGVASKEICPRHGARLRSICGRVTHYGRGPCCCGPRVASPILASVFQQLLVGRRWPARFKWPRWRLTIHSSRPPGLCLAHPTAAGRRRLNSRVRTQVEQRFGHCKPSTSSQASVSACARFVAQWNSSRVAALLLARFLSVCFRGMAQLHCLASLGVLVRTLVVRGKCLSGHMPPFPARF